MNPVVVSIILAAADDDIIALSQAVAAPGFLTLIGGSVTLTARGLARQVILTSGGDDHLVNFTITGTNASGNPQSEVLAGTNGSIAASVLHYQSVTSIYASAAVATTIKAGTNGVGSTRIVNPDFMQSPVNIGIGCVVSGTVDYTVQHTFDDVMNTNSLTWFPNSGLTAKTANADGNYAFAVRGIRILLNSGTGTVTGTIIQGTHY